MGEDLERVSMDEIEGEDATSLPNKEVMSLLDVNANVDLGLDLAAPVDLAVAANLNVAAPIEAAAGANLLLGQNLRNLDKHALPSSHKSLRALSVPVGLADQQVVESDLNRISI